MTETISREEVQLYSGPTSPEKYAHRVRISDMGVPRDMTPGTEVEALCGYRFKLTGLWPNLPVCPACEAVFCDNEAMGMAND